MHQALKNISPRRGDLGVPDGLHVQTKLPHGRWGRRLIQKSSKLSRIVGPPLNGRPPAPRRRRARNAKCRCPWPGRVLKTVLTRASAAQPRCRRCTATLLFLLRLQQQSSLLRAEALSARFLTRSRGVPCFWAPRRWPRRCRCREAHSQTIRRRRKRPPLRPPLRRRLPALATQVRQMRKPHA